MEWVAVLCVRFCQDVRCCWLWALRGYFKWNCRWRWRHTSVSAVIQRKAHQCPGCVLTRLRGRGSGLESVTLAEAQCQPGPGHHSLPLSRVLFKGKQISGPNVTARTRSLPLISTNQCPGLKSPFPLPSPPNPSSPVYPSDNNIRVTPPKAPAPDLLSPLAAAAQFIDITCQLSFQKIAQRINFNCILMLNILETLHFMLWRRSEIYSHTLSHSLRKKKIFFSLFIARNII